MSHKNQFIFDIRPSTKIFLMLSIVVLVLFTTLEFLAPGQLGKTAAFVDFHVFHLVGDYVRQGNVAQAYDFDTFQAHQDLLNPGEKGFMPWTYPPQFNLLLAGLAPLPLWLAYLVFMAATLVIYIMVLRKLAGEHFFLVFVLVLPVVFVTIRCGQNGFLTAPLIGVFCLLLLRDRDTAGFPLGLMAIKPHLVLGIAILVLLKRKVAVLAIAAATTILAVAVSTVVFGVEIWDAFLQSASDSSTYLREAQYPLFRMTSVYAWLRSWGFEANVALSGQIMMALVALGGLTWVHFDGWETRRLLGLAVLASLSISPYNYDYDLCSLAIALALLIPDVTRFASRNEMVALVVASWLATGAGMMVYILPQTTIARVEAWTKVGVVPSLGAIFYIAVAALLIRFAARGQRKAVARHPAAAPV